MTRRTIFQPNAPVLDNPESRFMDGFRIIHQERMVGLPIVNKRLEVASGGFRVWQNDWIGVIAAPWAVFAVMIERIPDARPKPQAGAKRVVELPQGDFAFTFIDDSIIGSYWMMSLLSPALSLEDSKAAKVFAESVFELLFKADVLPADDEDAYAYVPPNADGKLRRVIPIKVAPPREEGATLSEMQKMKELESKSKEPNFFNSRVKPVSRRSLFKAKLEFEKDDPKEQN